MYTVTSDLITVARTRFSLQVFHVQLLDIVGSMCLTKYIVADLSKSVIIV